MNKIDIDDLVKLLDDNMSAGSGHLEVLINKDINNVTVNNDFTCKSTACMIPTLHVDIDDKEE